MLKRLTVLLLSLCTLCGAASAMQPGEGSTAKEQKALQKAQKKKLRREARHFESLRNEAVEKFARGHQPSEISTPSFVNDFRISNVICAGDNITGTVMLHFDITPLYGGFRLYMGGERNGTSAFAKGVAYPSSDHYGRVYTMRGGQPEHVVVMFYNIAPCVDALDRVDISMGLALNTLNIITMRNVPIFWTYKLKVKMTTQIKFTTAEEAVKVIKSGDHIHLSSVASAPQCLINAMCARGEAGELKDVHIHHLHTEGPAPYADEKFEGVFQLDSFFVGGNVRKVTQSGYADYIPIFLSETQRLYRCGAVPCNVAMIQVSTPDKHGFVSLGTSVDATLAAVETAEHVIAVVNKYVPRAFGQAMIHSSKIDIFVQDDKPLMEAHFTQPNATEEAIGKHCAALIEDGATLQMGIGAIPNAVLAQLGNHKNLGIHTEMFADGVLPLVESGVINGEAKNIDKGKMVSTFLMGSQRVYDFIDDNPAVLMMDVGYTNDPYIISKNDRVTAINSALQVDITGQVCADSLGTKFYSGVGGQIDFVYGASLSKGGKAIIAMPSVTNKGISKIAPVLSPGAGVVTTRNHIHWFVTEHGAVDLYGKTLQERARLIISVADPSAQEELDRAAFERFGPHHHYVKGYMKK